jgi:hypothetical protein
MSSIRLPKDEYVTGDTFDNPFPSGQKIYQLHIYPDLKYDNNWVAAIYGEGEEITDSNRIIINQTVMKKRLVSGESNQPFITREEAIQLLIEIIGRFSPEHATLSFTR